MEQGCSCGPLTPTIVFRGWILTSTDRSRWSVSAVTTWAVVQWWCEPDRDNESDECRAAAALGLDADSQAPRTSQSHLQMTLVTAGNWQLLLRQKNVWHHENGSPDILSPSSPASVPTSPHQQEEESDC
uniref:Uncharacterized protein n=1 Tax=Knipowitschia caucasica TaxID=637954 RepID=A0AAV2JBL4_KNICA